MRMACVCAGGKFEEGEEEVPRLFGNRFGMGLQGPQHCVLSLSALKGLKSQSKSLCVSVNKGLCPKVDQTIDSAVKRGFLPDE